MNHLLLNAYYIFVVLIIGSGLIVLVLAAAGVFDYYINRFVKKVKRTRVITMHRINAFHPVLHLQMAVKKTFRRTAIRYHRSTAILNIALIPTNLKVS